MSTSCLKKKIAILGRTKFTANYERFLSNNSFEPVITLNPGEITACDGLLLPGGGDITPAFFGQKNKGSRNIDTELDILQIHALELCVQNHLPVLGICKGMQLINIAFGGSILQDMELYTLHQTANQDLYHDTDITPDCFLYSLYGKTARVNSCHHQCISQPGKGLRIVQTSCEDQCPEAIIHETLPILGVQWHPERIDQTQTKLSGEQILSWFSNGAVNAQSFSP